MPALKSVRDKTNNNIGKIVSFPILRFLALFCERSDEEEITRPRDDFFKHNSGEGKEEEFH